MFKKLVFQGFAQGDLPQSSWDRLAGVCKIFSVSPDKMSAAANDADGLFVKLGATVDRKLIDAMPHLRVVGMFGTGYGRIDVKYARKKNISVFNIADYATDGVAEFVFGVLLNYLRDLPRALERTEAGDYSGANFVGTQLRGKTIGIIGLGAIGSRVASIAANGFGMKVLYWSRRRKPNHESELVQFADVDDVLSRADYVSLHLALTPDTDSFMSSKKLRAIRRGTPIVNTAPMELLELPAVEELLANGDISLILDHPDEMRPEDVMRLNRYSNCTIYPPIAFATKEATLRKQSIFVENILAAERGEKLPNLVN